MSLLCAYKGQCNHWKFGTDKCTNFPVHDTVEYSCSRCLIEFPLRTWSGEDIHSFSSKTDTVSWGRNKFCRYLPYWSLEGLIIRFTLKGWRKSLHYGLIGVIQENQQIHQGLSFESNFSNFLQHQCLPDRLVLQSVASHPWLCVEHPTYPDLLSTFHWVSNNTFSWLADRGCLLFLFLKYYQFFKPVYYFPCSVVSAWLVKAVVEFLIDSLPVCLSSQTTTLPLASNSVAHCGSKCFSQSPLDIR